MVKVLETTYVNRWRGLGTYNALAEAVVHGSVAEIHLEVHPDPYPSSRVLCLDLSL